MPIQGKVLYPLRWYWRADSQSSQPVICEVVSNQVPTWTPALPDPPNSTTQTAAAFGSQPVKPKKV